MSMQEIANTIKNQIGHKALYMLGAKNISYSSENGSLSFKIMRNAKSVTHIRITLNGKDLYDVEYLNCNVKRIKTIAIDNDLYCDMLHQSIERNTNLYTSL